MLPKYIKSQTLCVKQEGEKEEQLAITEHVGKAPPKEAIIPYSDK